MGDLTEQTSLEQIGEAEFRIDLSRDWEVWGPNGGYVSAVLLRAVGMATDKVFPVSYAGQYLRVASFGEAIVEVECVRNSAQASAYSAVLKQDGKAMVQAQVWVANESEALDHQLAELPDFYVPLAQAGERPPVGPMPCWDNFEIRQVSNSGGHYSHWYRFVPEADISNPFADAARSLVLIDTMQWPARYYMEKTPPQYVAPSLDLYVQFHRTGGTSPWVFSDARSSLARGGLVSGHATVWDTEGNCLATGGSQSLLRPWKMAY